MYYTMQAPKYSQIVNETHNTKTKYKDVTDTSGEMFGINSSELCSAEFRNETKPVQYNSEGTHTKEVGSIHNDIPNYSYK